MRKVRVVGFSAVLGTGKVVLTPEQAVSRVEAGLLSPTSKENVYEVVALNTFKYGEEFGYDGEFPPSLLEDLAPVKVADLIEEDQEAAAKAAKAARINELEALGDAITEDEQVELDSLLSE